jgi:hypothetical protein
MRPIRSLIFLFLASLLIVGVAAPAALAAAREFPIPGSGNPFGIAAGPYGAMWFTTDRCGSYLVATWASVVWPQGEVPGGPRMNRSLSQRKEGGIDAGQNPDRGADPRQAEPARDPLQSRIQ